MMGKRIWTLYKKFYVRQALERGDSRELIADRLGVTLAQLRGAIRWYRLDKPEAAHG